MPAFNAAVLLIVVDPTCKKVKIQQQPLSKHIQFDHHSRWIEMKKEKKYKHTAIGAGLPGTLTAQGSPSANEGSPSAGRLIPGNIRSAPPMTKRETSAPFRMKAGKSSGTFQRA